MKDKVKTRTHYRNVAKSDHLSVADLEDLIEKKHNLIFTIKEVKQEIGVMVAGRKGNHNIAYFVEKIKPLVINSTNAKVIKSFNNASPFVEEWSNTIVQLHIANTTFAKEKTQGVRISKVQPIVKELKPFTEVNFEPAKKANASVELIKKGYSLTPEMETKYLEYVNSK